MWFAGRRGLGDVNRAMKANWVSVYNRLFEIIDQHGETYFSGPRFLSKVKEIDPYFPDYSQYIPSRNRSGLSTTRKVYFSEILLGFDDERRFALLDNILSDVEPFAHEKVAEIRGLLGDRLTTPDAVVPAVIWSADRLNQQLADIDAAISAGNHERAITLSYTTLEGFYKAFVRKNIATQSHLEELLALSREIKRYLGKTLPSYPDEALSMVNHISHTIDRARNKFSESHFENEADRWLSVYVRDLLNTQIRLLIHFI